VSVLTMPDGILLYPAGTTSYIVFHTGEEDANHTAGTRVVNETYGAKTETIPRR